MAWVVSLTVAMACGVWAAYAVLSPNTDDTPVNTEAVPGYVAEYGELSDSVTIQSKVDFVAGPSGFAPVGGTITSLQFGPENPVQSGQILLTIDLRPIVVAAGSVPVFRQMELGLSGPDIRQLRQFLGLSDDDYFDWDTFEAVRDWEGVVGAEEDGIVRPGDLIFLPILPTRSILADGLSVGSQVSAGQEIVVTYNERPSVIIPSPSNGPPIAKGMSATLDSSVGPKVGVLSEPVPLEDGGLGYLLVSADGGSACDVECASQFSIAATSTVPVEIEIVPPASGILIPISAIGVQPDGSTTVQTSNGRYIPVQIILEARGLAIVEGIKGGTNLLLFSDPGAR